MWRAFWCAIVAVLTMQHLNQEGMDKVVMFQVHYHHQWRRFELVPFLLLGVLGGLLGAAFNKLHLALLRWRRNTSAYASAPVLEAAFLSFISATIQYQAVYLRGSSTGEALSYLCMRPSATSV
jgi:chloride channel 3/4/5